MKRTLAALALAIAVATPPAAAAPFRTEAPEEAQVRAIAAKLRCPVCQSENILDSQSGTAREMVVMLREQLAQGRSEDEIIAYFRSRYGDYVLLSPPASGFGGIIWLVPPLLLVAACAAWLLLVRRNVVASRRSGPAAREGAPLDEQSLRRLEL